MIHRTYKSDPDLCLRLSVKRALPSVLISPTGETFTVQNVSAFCREHGLYKSAMAQVLTGKAKSHKGWTGYRLTQTSI